MQIKTILNRGVVAWALVTQSLPRAPKAATVNIDPARLEVHVAADVPAADDNASGVAGLIELAYWLGATSPRMQIELVAYTLEEGQHFRTQRMGSFVHARSLKQQGIPVRAMFSLEMLGFFSDASNSQRYPHSLMKLCTAYRLRWQIAPASGLNPPLWVRNLPLSIS